jgi:DNA-binding transcriptional ArsR family regulator
LTHRGGRPATPGIAARRRSVPYTYPYEHMIPSCRGRRSRPMRSTRWPSPAAGDPRRPGRRGRPVNDLVSLLGLAQPQVSKHLPLLREVGGGRLREHGRQRLYQLNGRALKPIHDWIKDYERSWSDRFDQLEVVLEALKRKEVGHGGNVQQQDGDGDAPHG